MEKTKKLFRSKNDRIIFGVCGGVADYFDIDPIIIRLLFVVLAVGAGSGLLVYLIAALIIPSEDSVVVKKEEGTGSDKAGDFVSEIGEKVKDLSSKSREKDWHFFLGLLLVIVGLSSLATNFIPLRIIFSFFWPFFIISLGLVILFKKK